MSFVTSLFMFLFTLTVHVLGFLNFENVQSFKEQIPLMGMFPLLIVIVWGFINRQFSEGRALSYAGSMKFFLKILYILIFVVSLFLFFFALTLHILSFSSHGNTESLIGLATITMLGIFPVFFIALLGFIHRQVITGKINENGFSSMADSLEIKKSTLVVFIVLIQAIGFYVAANFIKNADYGSIQKLKDGRFVSMNHGTIVKEYKTEEEIQYGLRNSLRFETGHPLIFYFFSCAILFRLSQLSFREGKE